MTWGAWTTIGNLGAKVSSASLTGPGTGGLVINSSPAAGDIVVVHFATDNIATVDGASNTHLTVTDTQGNSYSKLGEETNTVGGAFEDGVTVSIWITQLSKALTISVDSITGNFSSAVDAACMTAVTATLTAGDTWQSQGATPNGATGDAVTTGPTTTVGSLASAEHMWFAVDGRENVVGTYTGDVNFATNINRGTSGGVAATNISVHSELRKATLTTSSHAGSNTTSADWASLLVSVTEVANVAQPNVTVVKVR